MILTGNEIIKEYNNSKIYIDKFDIDNITTNSYDLTLGDELVVYTETILDVKKENKSKTIKIPKEGYLIEKNQFVLGASNEVVGSDFYVPLIHAKSGIARLGLFVHVTADLIDIGYKGKVTFQLYATENIKIYPNQKIGQITFWVPKGEIKLYNGKYMNSNSPQVSKIFKDFK